VTADRAWQVPISDEPDAWPTHHYFEQSSDTYRTVFAACGKMVTPAFASPETPDGSYCPRCFRALEREKLGE